MKIKKLILVTIIITALLSSCGEKQTFFGYEVTSTRKALPKMATVIYDHDTLQKIADFEGTIDELNAVYPIESLREFDDTCRASYLGKEHFAWIGFDKNGTKDFGKVYNIKLMKSDFKDLKGKSVEQVMELDPDGDYWFLHTGRQDLPSVHFTKDGYIIYVHYLLKPNTHWYERTVEKIEITLM